MLESIDEKLSDLIKRIKISPHRYVLSLIWKAAALLGISWGLTEFSHFFLSGFLQEGTSRFFSLLLGLLVIILGVIIIYVLEKFVPQDIIDFTEYVQNLSNMKDPEDFKLKAFIDSHYISLEGRGYWSKERLKFPLDSYCMDHWIKGDIPCLLVIGTAGTGKSILAEYLAYRLAKRYLKNPSTERIPILVNLRKMKSGEGLRALITDLLVNTWGIIGVSWKDFIQMHEEGKFMLILDGFDESLKRVSYVDLQENFDHIIQLLKPNGKMRVWLSTRPEVFISRKQLEETIPITKVELISTEENKKERITELTTDNDDSHFDSMIMGVEFSDITPNQVKEYLIKRFGKIEGNTKYKTIMRNNQLKDLSERAITLDMIAETIDEFKDSSEITLFDLYEKYTDKWIRKDIKRGTTILGKKEKLPLITRIARQWLRSDRRTITYQNLITIRQQLEKDLKVDQDDLNYIVEDLIKCSFLMHTMEHQIYTFNHKSFAEFFVNKDLRSRIRESSQIRLGRSQKTDYEFQMFKNLDLATQRGVLAFADRTFLDWIVRKSELIESGSLENLKVWLLAWIEYFDKNPRWSKNLLQEHSEMLSRTSSLMRWESGKLVYFDLSDCAIRKLSDMFFQEFIDLKHLLLNNNQITKIPDSIINLKKLRSLSMASNYLNHISDSIFKLQNIHELNFANNDLENLNPLISNLSNLEKLNLSRNYLTNLPSTFRSLRKLKNLDLSLNQLKEIPDVISILQNISKLNLLYNNICLLPDFLVDMKNLENIKIDYIELKNNQKNRRIIDQLIENGVKIYHK